MRQVFLEKNLIKIKEVCQPVLNDNVILVSVHYSCISPGTESATINTQQSGGLGNISHKVSKVLESISRNGLDATKALIKEKIQGTIQTMGYSCSGIVVATGKKVRNFKAGDFVACAGAGFAHHADMVAVPENLAIRLKDDTFLKQASLTTLGAIALQGIRRASIQLGEVITVMGLGLLGQLTVQLLKKAGCTVIGIDPLLERAILAQELGADYIFQSDQEDAFQEIFHVTHQHGVDAVIITAGSKSDAIIQQAMEITRKKGRVIVVGDVGLHLKRSPLYEKEIDVLISCAYGPGRYDNSYEVEGNDYPYAYVRWTENRNMQSFASMIQSNELNIDQLITKIVPISSVSESYDELKSKKSLAIVIDYKDQSCMVDSNKAATISDQNATISFIPATKQKIRVGVVGAGGFAKVKLLPILARMKEVKINAIVDTNLANSMLMTKVYGAMKALSNDKNLFDDDLVDAVMIASPHKYHCEQILAALQNGKAVFAEKPMVTDFTQLEELRTFIKQYPEAPLCIDYNRPFSPFMKKIKQELKNRTSPIVVNYRMNAGFIPKEHWIQSEIGAGRIIGEACHIFDLFCFLTDSKPISVSVESMCQDSQNFFPTDNFSTQVAFADGSLCTLIYTSLGHKEIGKERMELFFDSKTILLDDYIMLEGFGLPATFNEKSLTADKGHEHLLREFILAVGSKKFSPPIKFERLLTVAELTLTIDKLACQGGGNKTL